MNEMYFMIQANVTVTEYENQDLAVCVELVHRAKQVAQAALQYNPGNMAASQYGLPVIQQTSALTPSYYGQQQQPQRPTQPSFSNLDNNALQQILREACEVCCLL